MHIILVSNRLSTARTVTVSLRHVFAASGAMAVLVVALACGLFYAAISHSGSFRLPVVQSLVMAAQEQQAQKSETFLRQNLNAMAVKLGEMQAQLMRLDALGERLVSMSGMKLPEFRFSEVPGRGGALPSGVASKPLSMDDLNSQLDSLSRRMESRNDTLSILESQLFDAKVKSKLMPTITPVEAAWNASSFGWRIDPITGMQAMHEGVDFIAEVGTPIFAAASGIVTFAGWHHQYGNVVEIDHGNDFMTRYAH
ncbi:MAG TPA: M23 family metallopeptidase, partial [Burkholderiales bacterium]|nr:M23 family metallopeptidase [Burkholderiales bacterium]